MCDIRFIKKTSVSLMLMFIIIGSFSGCLDDSKPNDSIQEIIVSLEGKGDYRSIQDALDASKDNDTIRVYKGVYIENLLINTSVYLLGNDVEDTIIDGGSDTDVIRINEVHVQIHGFTIRNSGKNGKFSDFDAGIEIKSNNATILNCTIIDNNAGIDIRSDDNIISNCSFINNSVGMYSIQAINNKISTNSFEMNKEIGLYVYYGVKNHIDDANSFTANDIALKIKGSNENVIVENIFQNNNEGIHVCCGSLKNTIYHNNFINNSKIHADDLVDGNNWYNDVIKEGNYWDDYVGTDENNDNIGDSSYEISDVREIYDMYPLMMPT